MKRNVWFIELEISSRWALATDLGTYWKTVPSKPELLGCALGTGLPVS